jgi:hypothetical protein
MDVADPGFDSCNTLQAVYSRSSQSTVEALKKIGAEHNFGIG